MHAKNYGQLAVCEASMQVSKALKVAIAHS